MFGAQKSMFDTARGQHLSAKTCGLEGDSRWRRHGDFILAGRIRHGHADVWSTMEEIQQRTLHVLPSSALFGCGRPCQLATGVIEMPSGA